MQAIAAFLILITRNIVARVLTSLGIGIFSYASFTSFASNVILAAQSAYGGLSGDVLAILNLAGVGEVFGIIASAITTKASLVAIRKLGMT